MSLIFNMGDSVEETSLLQPSVSTNALRKVVQSGIDWECGSKIRSSCKMTHAKHVHSNEMNT